MDSKEEVTHVFPPFFRVYKNGRIERLLLGERVPPSTHPPTGVRSKDVIINPDTGVFVRIYLPPVTEPTRKLPLLIYIHGGAFSIGSAASLIYHRYLTTIAAEANVVVLSVDYRLAPEHPLPAAYEDTWAVVQWAALHINHDGPGPGPVPGPESWLNDHADFQRVYFVGDSAGANIAYNMVGQASDSNGLDGLNIIGLGLVHPFFMSEKPDKLIEYIFPSVNGCEDLRMNPRVNPKLQSLGCTRVVVYVAGKDLLKERGYVFHRVLKESGWEGSLEIVETEGEDHVFHLFNPECEKAVGFMKQVASFLNSA